MASLGSYIRSAARATFSAYRSVPVRWRLAGGSATLTFVILAAFAVLVGVLTTGQVRKSFDDQVRSTADRLVTKLKQRDGFELNGCLSPKVDLAGFASAERAQIRIFDLGDGQLVCTQDGAGNVSQARPAFPEPAVGPLTYDELGYRVEARRFSIDPAGDMMLLYAQPLSDLDQTLAKVRLFLLLGVLGGAVLALLAGLYVARRAMRPIAELTVAAREIERTRDPTRKIPEVEADDEVAELARTLEGMLGALDAARSDTEAMLSRQREFVADASHELRTPLTSVLANLELLAEELEGEQAETAQAALRSTRRMRRLVGDLLLLARADAGRAQPRRGIVGLDDVLIEAAAELEPVAEDHELSIDARPATVAGVRDDLHRLTLNLLENAVRHTPAGTHVTAHTRTENGSAVLIVEDDGPGIDPALQDRVFERFVRGAGDGGRGSGLGLAIVRAVTGAHGGIVSLGRPAGAVTGTRFEIILPSAAAPVPGNGEPAPEPAQTSTTTGSTIGRRRSRS